MTLLPLRAAGLQPKDGLAVFHQIEPVTGNRFQISRVGLEQIDFAHLAREQNLLIGYLRDQIVDFSPALSQFFVRRHEQTDDDEPNRDAEQDSQDPV